MSENTARGKYAIRFCPVNSVDEIKKISNSFDTSLGDIFIDHMDKKISLHTKNSVYEFSNICDVNNLR